MLLRLFRGGFLENMDFWHKDFWLLQSLDLNLLDFSIWWHCKSWARKVCHDYVDVLKASVNQQQKTMRYDYISNV